MSDIFQHSVTVVFQPRILVKTGKNKDESYQQKRCYQKDKYCFDLDHDFVEDKEPSPSDMAIQLIKEQCVFEALQGQKSHWFRFMDTLTDGCVHDHDESSGSDQKQKAITPECFNKALKFSQVFSNYDHSKFENCVNE